MGLECIQYPQMLLLYYVDKKFYSDGVKKKKQGEKVKKNREKFKYF